MRPALSLKRRLATSFSESRASTALRNTIDDVSYCLDGLESKNADVRKESLLDLLDALGKEEICMQISFPINKEFCKVADLASCRLAGIIEKGNDREVALACLAIAKAYSVSEEVSYLPDSSAFDSLLRKNSCLWSVARVACDGVHSKGIDMNEPCKSDGKSVASLCPRYSLNELNVSGLILEKLKVPEFFKQERVSTTEIALLAFENVLVALSLLSKYSKSQSSSKPCDDIAKPEYFNVIWCNEIWILICDQLQKVLIKAYSTTVKESNDSNYLPENLYQRREWYSGAFLRAVEKISGIREFMGLVRQTDNTVKSSHCLSNTIEAVDIFPLKCLISSAKNWLLDFVENDDTDGSIQAMLLTSLQIAANLTHDNEEAWDLMSEGSLELVVEMFLLVSGKWSSPPVKGPQGTEDLEQCVKVKPSKSSQQKRTALLFDAMLFIIGILANCSERHPKNRFLIGNSCKQVVEFLVSFFPSDVLEQLGKRNHPDDLEFGWTPEELITSSYLALLLGCLMRSNKENRQRVQYSLPGKSVVILMQILETFLRFQDDAEVLSEETATKTLEVMKDMRLIALEEQRSMGMNRRSDDKALTIPEFPSRKILTDFIPSVMDNESLENKRGFKSQREKEAEENITNISRNKNSTQMERVVKQRKKSVKRKVTKKIQDLDDIF